MSKFITKSKKVEVELKDNITYGDYQKIVEVYLDDSKNAAEKFKVAKKMSIEMVLVSINAATENLYDVLMTLSREDGEEIYNAIKAISDPKVDGNS